MWRLSVLFLAGTAVNVLFQVYTAFRGIFRPRKFSRHLMDAFFSLVMVGAVSAAVFVVNWGELRLYVPLSLSSGFLISNFLVGDMTYRVSYRHFRIVKKGAGWAKRKVVVPSGRFLASAGAKARRWIVPELPPEQDETPPPEPPADRPPPSPNPPFPSDNPPPPNTTPTPPPQSL